MINLDLKNLKNDSNKIILGLLLFHILQLPVIYVISAIINPYRHRYNSILNNPIIFIFSTIICEFLVFYVIGKNEKLNLKKIVSSHVTKKLDNNKLFSVFVFTIGINFLLSFISNIIINGIQSILNLRIFAEPNYNFNFTGRNGYIWILAICVIGPIIEEFVFRGVILNILKKYGEGFSVVISAILFSLLHSNLFQIPGSLFIGLVYGYITIKTGSIYYSVLLHIMNNAVAILPKLFIIYLPYVENIFFILFFICFIYSLNKLKLFKNEFIHFYNSSDYTVEYYDNFAQQNIYTNQQTFYERQRVIVTKEKLYKEFFITPLAIIFIIITMIYSIPYLYYLCKKVLF